MVSSRIDNINLTMEAWQLTLEADLNGEVIDASLMENLDEILTWVGGIRKGAAKPKDNALVSSHGELELSRRAENYLHEMFNTNRHGYSDLFEDTMSQDDAKRRYRKLLSVFHPDKGAMSAGWLNQRTEQIGVAYKEFLERGSAISISLDSDIGRKASRAKLKPGTASLSGGKVSGREYSLVGDAKKARNIAVGLLLVLSVMFLFLIYVSTLAI